MKILLLDDDTRDIPEVADVWRLLGHSVEQVSDWKKLPETIESGMFDAILLDLMIPAIGLPGNECGGGFTTGEYLYRTYIRPKLPHIPFAVFSSALFDLDVIKKADERLRSNPNYRGYFEKGCSNLELLQAISK